jgi:Cu+-exporting ATPase
VAIIGNERLMADHGIDTSRLDDDIKRRAAAPGTTVYVAHDGVLLGAIVLSDAIRPDAAAAVAGLTQRKISAWLLTGDRRDVAEAVAKAVGIPADRVIAGVLPRAKQDHIKALQAGGRRVAMVGDGINDAPALAQADVGVAIGTGTDVAIQASDVTLVAGDPRLIVTAIELSRATMRVIRQNLVWAFAYNVVLIPVAMGVLYPFTGVLLDPILAAAAMAISSVTVVANSLRLRRFKPPVPISADHGRAMQTAPVH